MNPLSIQLPLDELFGGESLWGQRVSGQGQPRGGRAESPSGPCAWKHCPSDGDLTAEIQLTLQGDRDAYQRIVKVCQPMIANQMTRFTRDPLVLEELVHDVFVEAFVSLPGFRRESPLEHWLRKLAVRVGYRHWRTLAREKSRRQAVCDWAIACYRDATNSITPTENVEELHAVLAQLSPRDRLVLTLLYWDGHSVAETAALAGWTQAMTRVQAHRARKRLKQLLEELKDG